MTDANGTMKRKLAEKLAQGKLDEALAQQRNAYLTKVGTSVQLNLDIFLQDEHDKLSVLVGLLSHLAARGGAKWEELERVVRENFEQQVQAIAAAKSVDSPVIQTA